MLKQRERKKRTNCFHQRQKPASIWFFISFFLVSACRVGFNLINEWALEIRTRRLKPVFEVKYAGLDHLVFAIKVHKLSLFFVFLCRYRTNKLINVGQLSIFNLVLSFFYFVFNATWIDPLLRTLRIKKIQIEFFSATNLLFFLSFANWTRKATTKKRNTFFSI